MKTILGLAFLCVSCSGVEGFQKPCTCPTPSSDIPNPTCTPTPIPIAPTVVPTSYPIQPTATPLAIQYCDLILSTTFNENTNQSEWEPSYYYNKPNQYPLHFAPHGLIFSAEGSYRVGVTKTFDRKLNCRLKIKVRGTIVNQTLSGTGYDDREAPLAVMIQYVDSKGILHDTLKAFNEGEQDDRLTTRMFWWGFGYLPQNNGYNNFKPSLTLVERDAEFVKELDLKDVDIKELKTITFEASGWTLTSYLGEVDF